MVSITTENTIIDILQKYIDSDIELQNIVNKIDEYNLDFSIKYEKYDSAINIHIAKLIVDYQETIYKIASLCRYGKPNSRILTQDEKDCLEMAFVVSSGCTNIIEKFGKFLERILPMFSEKQRGYVAVALVLIFFSYLSFSKYLDYKEKTKVFDTITQLQSQAMDKLSKDNKNLAQLVANAEKESLNTLSKVDSKVQINNQEFTREELREVRNKKFPRKANEKSVSTKKGIYKINDIKLSDGSIVVENNEEGRLTILYDTEDDSLLNYITDIKEHLKKAVDNENELFEITATIIKKGIMVESRVLQTIKEYKPENNK